MNDYIEYLGMLAGFCTTIALVPQLVKIIKTKKAQGISALMYAISITGVVLWIIYGIYHESKPMVIANIMTLFFASAILAMKLLIDRPSINSSIKRSKKSF